ncbi:MAG: DinB family protein [Anaerolineales bacterium]
MRRASDWFERQFTFVITPEMFPNVLERFRGTPARLAERVAAVPRELLTRRDGEDWSIQEHAGHLLDLGWLDAARLEDFRAHRPTLTAADVANRKTYTADHNAHALETLLDAFRAERLALVSQLEQLDDKTIAHTALHPRLNAPMNVAAWLFFMCEHDDHHLAEIGHLSRKWTA